MNTLKELKASIRPGCIIRVIDHWIPRYVGDERLVERVQKNGRYTYRREGEVIWGDLAPRSQLTFNPDGSVTVRPDEKRFWTIKVQPAAEGVTP
jgi:hypothetical protein